MIRSTFSKQMAQDMCTQKTTHIYNKAGELTGIQNTIDMACYNRLAPPK